MTADDAPPPNVLIVCTGNLCRSPLAAALLVDRLAAAGLAADVASAGLVAPIGRHVDHKLERVAEELGVEVGDHASTALQPDHLRHADLILTMTGEHRAHVGRLDASATDRATTLRAAAWKAGLLARRTLPFADWVGVLAADVPPAERAQRDSAYDIADPIGGPLRAYRAMGDEVDRLVRALVDRWSGR